MCKNLGGIVGDLFDFTEDEIAIKMNFSVKKNLFEAISIGSPAEKQSNSDYLIIGSQKYKLISDTKYKWIPKD